MGRFIRATPCLHDVTFQKKAPSTSDHTQLWIILDWICREYIPTFLDNLTLLDAIATAIALRNSNPITNAAALAHNDVLERIINIGYAAHELAKQLRPHSTELEWDDFQCNATRFTQHFGLDGINRMAWGMDLTGPTKTICSIIWNAAWDISRAAIKQNDELSSEDDGFVALAESLARTITT